MQTGLVQCVMEENAMQMIWANEAAFQIYGCTREWYEQEYGKSMDMLLIPYEDAKGIAHSREVEETVKDKKRLGIYIGPEGGFPEEEVSLAMKAGAEPVTLGHRILRTETAGMTLLSILMFMLEED